VVSGRRRRRSVLGSSDYRFYQEFQERMNWRAPSDSGADQK